MVTLSRVGSPEKILLAIKPPTPTEQPYTTTRNVVFHEVLETGAQAREVLETGAQAMEVQEEAALEVPPFDMECLDYEAIANEFDNELRHLFRGGPAAASCFP